MRLLGAGLFVWFGMMGLVGLIGGLGWFESGPVWIAPLGIAAGMPLLIGVAVKLFNPKGVDLFGAKSSGKYPSKYFRDLEEQGLLETEDFTASRAFGVEEYDDEGLHYYLELADGGVLFLTGQYLYDYEPTFDDSEINQPRYFPCTEFSVLRHKAEGYVVDIVCRGDVLEPELVAPPFDFKDFDNDLVPEDGQIISDVSYDELKRQRTNPKTKQTTSSWWAKLFGS
ncbi:hypothetical protein SAMN02745216_00074 [Desulfatibacillum alkenivorans DSM 16219]|jgi:hypothetical protein|uniref:Uncharacterized protein n=2 Tax=Desulfatibacillum alkenivorans TaxID=259354 RepID=A0A1M6BUH3_9BACT|nr:hypothetical protein SAMN02745216_00074 [Desulfatibacillum alkenivorans DSM 16219]